MKKVIRGGTVVNASESVRADVLIDGETIAGVGSFEGVDAELIDASGCYVLPGAIDNHTHLSMPFGGTWTSDDYDTGTQAAAAGGTTCIVDFALQMHPGGLRSSLEEWMGRADGAAHVDYGFHMAITNADAATIADMAAIVGEGVASFKVFLAYPNVLMVTDDQFLAVLERARELDALTWCTARTASRSSTWCRRRWPRARSTRSTTHSRGRRRWRPRPPGRASAWPGSPARRSSSCTSPAGSRPRRSSRARAHGAAAYGETCIQYLFNSIDDLRRPGLRGRALRLLAAAARRLQPAPPLGCPALRSPADRLDRPLPVQRRAEAPRPRRLLEDPEWPGRDPASAADAVGARRAPRAALDEPRRRDHVDRRREDVRPASAQGRDRAGRRRRHRRLRSRQRGTCSRRRPRS